MKIEKQIADLVAKKASLIDALKAAAVAVEQSVDDEAKYEAAEKSYNDVEAELADTQTALKDAETKKADLMARAKRVDEMVGAPAEDASVDQMNLETKMTSAHIAKFSHEKGADYAGAVEIRKLMSQVGARKHGVSTLDMAKHLFPNDKRVQAVVRAPVGIPETLTPGIGDVLVIEQQAQGELIDLLRNTLTYTRMPGMRSVPLPANRGSVRIPRTTGAISASWVEEGNSIPVSRPSMDTITISPYKLGVVSLSTRELMERSDPAFEQILRDQIVTGIAEAVDTTFISDLAATAGSPAGLFTGLAPLAAAGTLPAAPTAAQVINFLNAFKLQSMLQNMGGRNFAWLMHPSTMVSLMSLRNALDGPLFPELTAGQLQGYPVISTTNVPVAMPVSGDKIIAFIDATEIFFGLGSGIALATSDQAYIQSDSTPNSPPTGGVSLFQQEMMAIRGVLDTTWARRRDNAVIYAPTLM
jgi:HK97 family phage major capsid protein